MSKDTIFKDQKEPARERSLPKYKFPKLSYCLCYPLPFIDSREYIRLLPDELVQEGDEFYYGTKWCAASKERCGMFVDHIFVFRRSRAKFIANLIKYPAKRYF